MHKYTVLALLLASLSIPPASAENATLTLSLHGIKEATGNLRAGLYREPETFRKEDKAVQVISQAASAGEAKLVFKDVPPGRYAIMAYHDENADNRLNLRLGMFPTEGYGLSNNPSVFGPPKFADSAFEVLVPETAVDIKLSY
jgi:uncharacterized protein (DUF2141 family)